jgi:hypothetical protein
MLVNWSQSATHAARGAQFVIDRRGIIAFVLITSGRPGETEGCVEANRRLDCVILPGQRHGYGNMSNWFYWVRSE